VTEGHRCFVQYNTTQGNLTVLKLSVGLFIIKIQKLTLEFFSSRYTGFVTVAISFLVNLYKKTTNYFRILVYLVQLSKKDKSLRMKVFLSLILVGSGMDKAPPFFVL
jgi:hypothetical protein